MAAFGLVVGLCAVVLGIKGVNWGYVLPLGGIALVLSVVVLGARRDDGAAAGSLAAGVGWAAAVAAITGLILGVWGSAVFLHGTGKQSVHAAAPPASAVQHASSSGSPDAAVPVINGPLNRFGTTTTVDGISVRLSEPRDYTPSVGASTTDGSRIQRAVRFTLTLSNNSDRSLSAVGVNIEGVAGNRAVPRVYDNEIGALPSDVAAGATVTLDIALSVPPDRGPLTVIVQPAAMTSNDEVFFAGTA